MPLELSYGWTSLPAPEGLALTKKWEAVKDARLPLRWKAGNSGVAVEMAQSLVHYKPEQADHWQTPEETLELGTGDCEDWCLFIRALLLNGGIPPAKLWLLVCRDLVANMDHALLWTPIRFCDVRAFAPLTHDKFIDYRPIAAFNIAEAVTFGKRRG